MQQSLDSTKIQQQQPKRQERNALCVYMGRRVEAFMGDGDFKAVPCFVYFNWQNVELIVHTIHTRKQVTNYKYNCTHKTRQCQENN